MSGFGWATTALEVVRTTDLRGRLAIVTGASSGMGIETAQALAVAGADLVLGVRDVAAGEAVARDVLAGAAGTIKVARLDLSDLDAVAEFAGAVTGPVDLLIANAGVSQTPDTHLPNGLDVRFATNHLGHFRLAALLRSQLAKRGARIVVVSSGGHKGIPVSLDDPGWRTREYSMGLAYAESKSANILFAQEATRRWSGEGIFANAVLPGTALTGLQRHHSDAQMRRIGFVTDEGTPAPMVRTAAQAAATAVWAATAPELAGRGGLVLEDCGLAKPVGPDTHPWSGYDDSVADPDSARRLWEISTRLIDELTAPAGPGPAPS
ncbi:hypothetical protein CC117_14280 [Parafrankia colletiae]|uniref:Short-chain alcohol dehydrogenase n=1 Tax=Parafrankia colletiae TaxID=573497 RepID=A0A1S1R040_9ACTN|nr:SDR family NAD(P)-dependent oxidoreductase [Parafrankia colletiae]MCK9903765.1 SDR family NAD(P)-dependent oxidoreductase [Frankia sp. Cpl3]OHV40318.1 hypothetical protein CC117_14280 [Parafrankia colletiae]